MLKNKSKGSKRIITYFQISIIIILICIILIPNAKMTSFLDDQVVTNKTTISKLNIFGTW